MAYDDYAKAPSGVTPEDIIDDKLGKPEAQPEEKPTSKKMSDDDFQNLVFNRATSAKNYVDSNLVVDRVTATDYYHGRLPDVDVETVKEDRSQAVLSEVRDTVLGMMPDLLRIFSSSEGVVEYKPVPSEDPQKYEQNKQEAKLATEFVRSVVLNTDNPDFFVTLHDAFKDALVRKTGIVKWYWEKNKKPEYSFYTDLPEDAATALAADDEVTIVSKTSRVVQPPQLLQPAQMPMMQQPMAPQMPMQQPMAPPPAQMPITPMQLQAQPYVVYDIEVKRVCEYGKIKICGVPCENVIVSDLARSIDDAPIFGYVEEWNAGDFVARGYIDSLDEIKDCDTDINAADSVETQARRPNRTGTTIADREPPEDPSQRKVLFAELYLLADYDGDGIPELRRVHTAGTRYKVLSNEPWDEVDYASFCPIPEAHTFFGESIADLTMDLQRIKSRIMRDMLDSLAQSVKPQTAVVEGQVNLDDVLNPDTSNVVRQRAPGMIQPLTIPFVGKDALPVLDFITGVREARTGMSDAAAGLDPKDLQSADADAVQNTLQKGAARIELIARIFIETGMKRIFRGVLRLLKKHQNQSRLVELNGRVVRVDPRHWDAAMHVETTIPLGRGTHSAQVGFLTGIMGKQEQVLQMLGPTNPLVSLDHYYNTWAQLMNLGGFRNVDSFIRDPSKMSPEERQQVEQAMMQAMAAAAQGGKPSQGPAAPDPMVEQAKIASNERIKQADIAQKQAQMQAELQFKSVELQANVSLEIAKAHIGASSNMDIAQLQGIIDHVNKQLDSATKIAVEKLKPRGGADNGSAPKPQ